MVVNVCCKFVSQKINKIRWKPVSTEIAKKPDTFVCGGWQNAPNTSLTVWACPELSEPKQQPIISNRKFENVEASERLLDPKLLYEIPFDGDVMDIKYITKDIFAAGSSNGTLSLYKHESFQPVQLEHSWEGSHSYQTNTAPCTSIDSYGESMVSVGEDGRLIQYDLHKKQPVNTIDADSCALTAVAFLKHDEVVTANSQGQLNVWDLRKPGDPVKSLVMPGEQSAVLALNRHPTLPNVLACGSEDGALMIWDLKIEKYPETLLSAHKGPIFELKFHPISPNHLFTCSMDGSIWHWDSSGLKQNAVATHATKKAIQSVTSTPWLLWNTSKQQLEICSLIPSSSKPINSLDILQDVLLCGSDNESFYILSDLPV